MDFAKSRLLDDPLVKRAFNILEKSNIDKDTQKTFIQSARILSTECTKKDPELVAAALLQSFRCQGEADKDLTQRTEDIVNAFQNLGNTTAGADATYAAEAKLLHLASITADMESILADAELIFSISPLAIVFSEATGDGDEADTMKEELREYKSELRKAVRENQADTLPFIGTTGETKLEERFLNSHNDMARIVNEPISTHPSRQNKAVKPVAPKPPIP